MRIRPSCGIILILLVSMSARAEVDWPPKKTREWKAFQALNRAVDRDDVVAVRRMVRSGADVDGKKAGDDFVPMDRPLLRAVRKGNLEMVKLLLKAGAMPDWCCCSCVTALHEAIRNRHARVVRALLEAGANPQLLYDGETSPIELAERAGDNEVIALIGAAVAERKTEKPRSPDAGAEQGVGPDVRSPAAPARR